MELFGKHRKEINQFLQSCRERGENPKDVILNLAKTYSSETPPSPPPDTSDENDQDNPKPKESERETQAHPVYPDEIPGVEGRTTLDDGPVQGLEVVARLCDVLVKVFDSVDNLRDRLADKLLPDEAEGGELSVMEQKLLEVAAERLPELISKRDVSATGPQPENFPEARSYG
jgi:hypothetical protein